MPLCSETLHNCFCSAAGPPCINVYKRAQRSAKRTSVLFFPPKKIQRCRAEGRSVRYGSVWDGSNPPSPPGRGPAGTARSTAPRRTATRSVPPVTAQLRPRPPPAAIPAPLRSPRRPHPEHSPYLSPARHSTVQHALPVPVPVPTPAPQGVSDGTAPSWGRPGRGGAVPDRAEPSPAGGSAPSPAPAPPWQRGYVGARAVPHESFLF